MMHYVKNEFPSVLTYVAVAMTEEKMTKGIIHNYNTKMSVKCYNNHNTFEHYDLVAIIELVAPTCILAPKS